MVPAASTLMPKASQTHVKALQRSSKAASTTRDGDYSIKISLKAQSGVFGTALRLVKPTGLLLFPGPEARFVGQDLEKAPVTLIDPQGQDSRCYELCSVSIMCNNALPCILSQLSMLTQVQLSGPAIHVSEAAEQDSVSTGAYRASLQWPAAFGITSLAISMPIWHGIA